MNERSGLLALAAYLTAAMVIVLVVGLAIFKYGRPSPLEGLDPIAADPAPEFAVTRLDAAPGGPPGSARAGYDKHRIRVLESMLADKTQRLQELSARLALQNEEYENLKRRYDEAMIVAVQSLSTSPEAPAAEEPGTPGAATAHSDQTRLAAQLTMARSVHEATLSDLAILQDELARVYEELGQANEEAGRQSADRLREALILEAATAGVLLRVGKDAVPALREALTHNSPVVRRWAATVLGGIGADAGDAVLALTEALTDSDASVRRAAQTALDAIER